MLLDGAKFGDVRKTIAEKYGVQPRSIDRYVKQARDELMMESGKSREEWRALNIERYLLIYRTPGTRALDRIKALERIDKLLGLEVTAPRQVQLTGADGGPIKSETSATVVVAGVDLGGRLKEVGAKVRAAALQTLLEAVQADPAALAAPAIEIEAVPVESPAAVQAESEQV